MIRTYPQEFVGETLIEARDADESRRVFLRCRSDYVEVGEFSRGTLTQEAYGTPVHFHCVQVAPVHEAHARAFFSHETLMLADYMDRLDGEGIPYGYLNDIAGKYVSYRPAGHGALS